MAIKEEFERERRINVRLYKIMLENDGVHMKFAKLNGIRSNL